MNDFRFSNRLMEFSRIQIVKRYGFRIVLPLLGFLLAQGAPIGLFIHTFAFGSRPGSPFLDHVIRFSNENVVVIVYVWLGTSFFFSAFAYFMGKIADILVKRLEDVENLLTSMGNIEK